MPYTTQRFHFIQNFQECSTEIPCQPSPWLTHNLTSHTKQKQKQHVERLGSQNGLFSAPGRLSEAGLAASSDQCHAPDCTVKRRTERAQWRQGGLYAGGSSLARASRTRVRADGTWERSATQDARSDSVIWALTSLCHRERERRCGRFRHINCIVVCV